MGDYQRAERYTHSDGYECAFPEEKRCIFRRRHPDFPDDPKKRQRCKRLASVGLSTCAKHGANQPDARAKSERIKAMAAMKRLVTPIDGQDIEANPIAAFEMEFRRTIGRIRYLDDQLAELDPKALIWGVAKETSVGSGEYPGVDVERVAQVNIYYEMQVRERKHLLDMIKVWIGAKLDIRKLEVEEQKVDALNGVLVAVLRRLGHDTNNPEVRRTVREEMLALPVAGTSSASVIATAKDIVGSPHSLVTQAAQQIAREAR